MMSLWDALRMNMMISYQELVRTFPNICHGIFFSKNADKLILKLPPNKLPKIILINNPFTELMSIY